MNVTTVVQISVTLGLQICAGVDIPNDTSAVKWHIIPIVDDDNDDDDDPYPSLNYIRSTKCYVLTEASARCGPCLAAEKILVREKNSAKAKLVVPAKNKAPLSMTHRSRIEAALVEKRIENKELKTEVALLRKEIEKNSVAVDEQLSSDFTDIMNSNSNVTPFMKLFWEQQQAYRMKDNRKQVRFHPMIIRYCLSLYMKSKSAYEELRNSDVLVLPSSRTLIDYKNHIRPKTGFNEGVIEDLKKHTSGFSDHERFCTILMDEMKIMSNLIFDKHTGELKGYLDLGSVDVDFSTLGREKDELATHALVFYLRGVISDLKYSLAYFATDGAVSVQIMALFWEAVTILEFNVQLKVIATVCDKASPNMKFFQLHRTGTELCHKTEWQAHFMVSSEQDIL